VDDSKAALGVEEDDSERFYEKLAQIYNFPLLN
jgi:hypothetical protein